MNLSEEHKLASEHDREGGWEDFMGSDRSGGLLHDVLHKLRLWLRALADEPFYRFGEAGNILFTVGKSVMEGAVLYSMFSMAEREFQVAAVLGVLTKYVYPAITIVSSVKVASYVDHVEGIRHQLAQIRKLIRGLTLVAVGESLGAIFLMMCYPPLFGSLFGFSEYSKYLLVVLFLLHHICDGSSQIVEGRIWFKLIEIKIRHGSSAKLAGYFWGIHAMSQNIQLVVGLLILWSTTLVVAGFGDALGRPAVYCIVGIGFLCACVSKFMLPVAWKIRLQGEVLKL